jgi:hypothetical protein
VPELDADEAPLPALAEPELRPPEVLDAPRCVEVAPLCVDDLDAGAEEDVDGTDTDGTVPTGVWTAGVEAGGVGLGAGSDGGFGTWTGGVGTWTGGVGTCTGGGVGTGTGTCTGGGVGTWTGGVVGNGTSPAASPQNEIEVPTTATPSHQRRRSIFFPLSPVHSGAFPLQRKPNAALSTPLGVGALPLSPRRRRRRARPGRRG